MLNSKLNAKDIARGLYSFLKKNESEALLPEVIKALGDYGEDEAVVKIFSAVKLGETERKKCQKLAQKLIGQTDLTFEFIIRPEIVDGLKISLKDKVWDLTLERQLNSLVKQISK